MIEITNEAQSYFRHLLEQQDMAGMALRMCVIAAGTPDAGCDLQFCPPGGQQDSDSRVSFEAFELFIEADSLGWLQNAEIDFEADDSGGQLTIKAPDIKGNAPTEDAPLPDRVEWLLNAEINPRLASHGGRVALVEITAELEVVLQFGGGCHGCGMVDVTLKEGIEKTLQERIPEITGILDATDHTTGSNPYYAS